MLTLITSILPIASTILDRILPEKVEKDKIKAAIQAELINNTAEIERLAANNIKAEIQGESWLQRNWRPMLMCLFGYIIAHNHIIAPILSIEFLPMPQPLWELLKIGIGGYVISLGAEKSIKTWRNN